MGPPPRTRSAILDPGFGEMCLSRRDAVEIYAGTARDLTSGPHAVCLPGLGVQDLHQAVTIRDRRSPLRPRPTRGVAPRRINRLAGAELGKRPAASFARAPAFLAPAYGLAQKNGARRFFEIFPRPSSYGQATKLRMDYPLFLCFAADRFDSALWPSSPCPPPLHKPSATDRGFPRGPLPTTVVQAPESASPSLAPRREHRGQPRTNASKGTDRWFRFGTAARLVGPDRRSAPATSRLATIEGMRPGEREI